MSKVMSRRRAQNWLAMTWFIGGAILLLILVVLSLVGKYGDKVGHAWGWFLPIVLPTLSLVAGVLVKRIGNPKPDQLIGTFVSRLTSGASIFYLMIVSLTIFFAPIAGPPLEVMQMSNLWLGPLQGLVCGLVGAFFLTEPAATVTPA